MTIPPLGERPGERVDEVVARLNRIIVREAEARELPCIDLHAAVERQLPPAAAASAPPYDARRSQRLAVRSVLLRYLLGWSWDRIAAHHGLRLLPDQIHLGETAGVLLVELVEQAVRRKAAADC